MVRSALRCNSFGGKVVKGGGLTSGQECSSLFVEALARVFEQSSHRNDDPASAVLVLPEHWIGH